MKKLFLIVPMIALLAAGCKGSATTNSSPYSSSDTSNTQTSTNDMATMPDTSSTSGSVAVTVPAPTISPTTKPPVTTATVKTFTVTGQNFSFSPNTLTVKKGDQVKITFKNVDGFHNLMIDGYNLKTPTISSGQSADLTFTADKTGTFAFYCGVANHRAMGMAGTLTVQ